AFVSEANGHLAVNYWDGSAWHWADQGVPPGSTVKGSPGVTTYVDGAGDRRIYAFVGEGNGHLGGNYWDGAAWHWADQGPQPGSTVYGDRGVITYMDGAGNRRIYSFADQANGHLGVNYWDGYAWRWADQGVPPIATVNRSPGVTTYVDGAGNERIYS